MTTEDDIDIVLLALESSPRVKLLDGSGISLCTLVTASGSTSTDELQQANSVKLAPDVAAEAALRGCRRLCEIVHGSTERKNAAVSRGVLPLLAAVATPPAPFEAVAAAARAVRTVAFKCEAARDAAAPSGALVALVRALLASVEALRLEEATSAQAAAALAATDEACTTLIALVNRHDGNAGAVRAEGGSAAAAAAVDVLQPGRRSWPTSSAAAAAAAFSKAAMFAALVDDTSSPR